MSDPDYRDGAGRSRTAYRGRLILLITLPVLLLGGSYFLFIEYLFAQPDAEFSQPLIALRIGGIVFTALAVFFALSCGLIALGRMSRPVRILLGLAEEGSLSSESEAFLYRSDWDSFYLSKRLQGLQAQSRSGAVARSELERVSLSLSDLREDLELANRAAGSVGNAVVQDVANEAVDRGAIRLVAEVAQMLQTNRNQLNQFFADLRTQTEILREEIARLRSDSPPSVVRVRPELPHAHAEIETSVGNGGADLEGENGFRGHDSEASSTEGAPSVEEAAEKLRQLGSVLALEMERVDPDPAGLGVRYQRFTEALEILESALMGVSSMKAGLEDVDDIEESTEPHMPAATIRWDQFEETLGILEQRLDEVSDR